jgi:predicted ATPase
MMSGDHRPARAGVEAFLAEAEAAGLPGHAAFARRMRGFLKFVAGDFAGARADLEQALADFDEQRDESLRTVFFFNFRSNALAHLGYVSWFLGEFEEAERLTGEAFQRAKDSGQPMSYAGALFNRVSIGALRGRAEDVLSAAEEIRALVDTHDWKFGRAIAATYADWARVRLGAPRADAFRAGLGAYVDLGARMQEAADSPLLAEVELAVGERNEALAAVERGLALAAETGVGWTRPWLLRLRGDALAETDPAGAASAYRDALSVAGAQGSRALALMAALALAKLLKSTGEAVEAHAILSDALEGVAPTPLFPEIGDAQALLAALAESDEVKAEAASRQRRLQLQTRYGQAMMYSRGFGSEESKTAFARARTLAAGVGDAGEQFDAYYGLYVGSELRGELSLARETAESFLREAENEGRMTEASVARRCVGFMHLRQGDFIDARTNLTEALRIYDFERDRDTKLRFGADSGAAAAGWLALPSWALGDVERARALSEEAEARADETAHAPTRAYVYISITLYQVFRGDPEAVRRMAKTLLDLAREHGMALFLASGEVHSNWARARLGDCEAGMLGLREALAAYLGQGNKLWAPLFQGRLAELEAEGRDADGALRRIDCARALADETGEHLTDALLHRIRGAILLKRDPANSAPAEEAFLAAIAIAQAQRARSFELQAALALAKLYQSTGRLVEAHAVLTQALEGFLPTPEMPEIVEAQALMERLA